MPQYHHKVSYREVSQLVDYVVRAFIFEKRKTSKQIRRLFVFFFRIEVLVNSFFSVSAFRKSEKVTLGVEKMEKLFLAHQF